MPGNSVDCQSKLSTGSVTTEPAHDPRSDVRTLAMIVGSRISMTWSYPVFARGTGEYARHCAVPSRRPSVHSPSLCTTEYRVGPGASGPRLSSVTASAYMQVS